MRPARPERQAEKAAARAHITQTHTAILERELPALRFYASQCAACQKVDSWTLYIVEIGMILAELAIRKRRLEDWVPEYDPVDAAHMREVA